LTVISDRPAATSKRKDPSPPVTTVREPMVISAPARGWPDTASTARPVTAIS
jgi:hypothetical protein